MLPQPHVMSGRLAKQKKTSAVSQHPLVQPVAINYSQPNYSMVLHHSCSAPRPSGSTGEMISSRAEVSVYLWGEPLSHVKLVGK